MRYNVGDAKELFNDILGEFEDVLALTQYVNRSDRTIKHNGNMLRVHGLHTQTKKKGITDSKVGLQKGKSKYAIVIREEAHQIPFAEITAFMEAMRGYEYILEVNLSNP